MTELTCRKCGFTGALDEFIKDKRAKLGRRNVCRSCERERLRKYQRENRDKVNESNRKSYYKYRDSRLTAYKEYAEKNKDKRSEQARERYLRNRDNILKTCAEYRKNHPEVQRAAKLRRRAREKALNCELETKELTELMERFGNRCVITGEEAEHLDHFIPVSTGHGGTIYENLVPVTASINTSKHGRNPFLWAEKYLTDDQKENFDKVVEYLAELNGLTVEEYRRFVFWCFENKRSADEITDENRDSLELWMRIKDAV